VTPSTFQLAIFDAIKDVSAGNLMIAAVAGSGKTTTIVSALSKIPADKRIIMLAFNKKIAEELSSRVKLPNVQIRTFHAVGLQVCKNLCKNPRVDASKVSSILRDYASYFNIDTTLVKGWDSIKKILSIGKNSGIGVIYENTEESWMNIIHHHDIFRDEEVDMPEIIEALIKCLNKNNNIHNIIDFDDMVYFPILFNLPFPKYDWVFADEVQDASEINRKSLSNLLAKNGRLCVVGDPYQAIYGFRGADSNSMNELKNEFGCIELPLSVSYRCSKSIVEEAKKIVDHIMPSDSAGFGSVINLDSYTGENFSEKNSSIICRNTAPLVKMTYSLIAKGIPAVMLGRDIGKGLVTLIKGFKCSSISSLKSKLDDWKSKSVAKADGDESIIDSILDKYDCISIFISNSAGDSVASLISEIDSFFSDESVGSKITLATIHKSKGLEWDRVYLLDKNRLYPKWATKPWMREQERNIHYVAVTRAKNELIYISSDSWK